MHQAVNRVANIGGAAPSAGPCAPAPPAAAAPPPRADVPAAAVGGHATAAGSPMAAAGARAVVAGAAAAGAYSAACALTQEHRVRCASLPPLSLLFNLTCGLRLACPPLWPCGRYHNGVRLFLS